MNHPAPSLLVVEDEPVVAAALLRALQPLRNTIVVSTVAEARNRLESEEEWAAAVVDVGLPDGSGLDVVRYARQAYPLLPILVLTGRDDVPTINETHRLRASFACKPFDLMDIVRFAQEALSFERIPEERLASLVATLATECALTPREAEVVTASLTHRARQDVLAVLKVSENTLKSQVKSVLRKTGHDSMQALSRALLRDALSKK